MRKIAVLVLGLMVAGCAQPMVDVPRDVYGAAAKGPLPPEVPKNQQLRFTDDIWKKSVAACIGEYNSNSPLQFSPAEINRFCACNIDLMQTRFTAAKIAEVGMDSRAGKPPSPRDLPEMLPIIAACWPR